MDSTTLKAIKFAREAHRGQIDKSGMAYWCHPYRVGLSCREHGPEVMAAGFLHDVVEDTVTTLDQLREMGFSEATVAGVDGMTRRDGESYRVYMSRVMADPVARLVKMADLRDNLREDRLLAHYGNLPKTKKRKKMYAKYLKVLEESE